MPSLYKQREGWFNWEWFYDLAVERAKDGDMFLEIGTWNGRSATYMAEKIIESGKDLKMVCVDPYIYGLHGTGHHPHDLDKLKDFKVFCVENGFESILIPVVGKSSDVSRIIADGVFSMIYIDGDHTYEGCLADIEAYHPKLKEGALFGGHDYELDNWEGVVKAVKQAFGDLEGVAFQVVKDTWFIDPVKLEIGVTNGK